MNLTPIDFIAQNLSDQQSKQEGYVAAPRWMALREDLKIKYRKLAEDMFEDWKKEEISSKQAREEMLSNIKITYLDETT